METSTVTALFAPGEIGRIFFWIGYIFGLTSTLLIIGSVLGMCLRPAPRAYSRTIEIMTIILVIGSILITGAYVAEIVIAYASNRYEFFTFMHARFGNYPLDGFALIYWLSVFSVLVPQVFWWARFRRSYLAVLLIALTTSFGIWYERLVVFVTSHSGLVPSSWQQ